MRCGWSLAKVENFQSDAAADMRERAAAVCDRIAESTDLGRSIARNCAANVRALPLEEDR